MSLCGVVSMRFSAASRRAIVSFFAVVLNFLRVHRMKDTSKQKKKPTAPKLPFRPGKSAVPGIGLIQERLIGRLVVERSNLEAGLNDMIWHLLNLSIDDGRVLTGRFDAVTNISMLRVLAPRFLEGDHLNDLLAVLSAADKMREDRNFIVYDVWGTLIPEGTPNAISIRAKSEPGEVIAEGFSHTRMKLLIKNVVSAKNILVNIFHERDPSREI
jgi:hypothetical protein